MFADYFPSAYNTPRVITDNTLYDLKTDVFTFLPSKISLSLNDTLEGLNNLGVNRNIGPDGISVKLIYHCEHALYKSLYHIFEPLSSRRRVSKNLESQSNDPNFQIIQRFLTIGLFKAFRILVNYFSY